MKRIFLVLVIILSFSCKEKEKNNFQYDIKEEAYKTSKLIISDKTEAIILYAIKNDLPSVKVKSVVVDYLAKKDYLDYELFDDINSYNKILDSIATKNKLSKKEIASILYAFKYETVSLEDIGAEFELAQEEYFED